jgi:hypothetical protein
MPPEMTLQSRPMQSGTPRPIIADEPFLWVVVGVFFLAEIFSAKSRPLHHADHGLRMPMFAGWRRARPPDVLGRFLRGDPQLAQGFLA